MKRKDHLIVTLVPLALLLIPLVGNLTVQGWNWHWNDFLFAYVVFALTAFAYRLLATRQWSNLTYRLGLARLQPGGMAKVAFGMAAALFLIPVVAVIFWPADFSPGVAKVFLLNFAFVLIFIVAGLLFRHAAAQPAPSATAA